MTWRCPSSSARGLGVFYCNSFEGYIDVAATDPQSVAWRTPGGEVDYFLFAPGRTAGVVSAYTRLTGRMKLPPRWAFGYWQAPASTGTEQWAYDTVTKLRERGFPIDALHMDGWNWERTGWHSRRGASRTAMRAGRG